MTWIFSMLGLPALHSFSGCVTGLETCSIYLWISKYHHVIHIFWFFNQWTLFTYTCFCSKFNGLKGIQLLPNVSVSMKESSGRGPLGKIVFSVVRVKKESGLHHPSVPGFRLSPYSLLALSGSSWSPHVNTYSSIRIPRMHRGSLDIITVITWVI